MSEAENVEVVKKLVNALNTFDHETWATLYTDDVTGQSRLRGGGSQGIESRKQSLVRMQEDFEILHDEITGLWPSGDHVILEVKVHTKLAKERNGEPAGTEKTKYELFIYKFRDGKIAESLGYV